jgi:trans-aconitate methyltransferase
MRIDDLNQNYNQIANEFSASRQNLHWPLLDLFLAQIKDLKQPRILDLGCGSGRFYQYLLDHKNEFPNGFEYLGIDQSADLIKQAQATHGAANFKVARWQDLNAKDFGSFDVVVALASFHHLPRPEQVDGLRRVYDVMNKNSFLFLTVWNLWNRQRHKSWWTFIKDRLFLPAEKFSTKYSFAKKDLSTWQDTLMLWKNKIPLFYYAFRRNELRNVARGLGFSEIVCQYENDSWRSGDNLYLIAKKP